MKYMGSKRRIASVLIKAFQQYASGRTNLYEPFVGGANLTIAAVQAGYICHPSDIDKYLIAYLQALAKGWLPPDVFHEAQYQQIRQNPNVYPPELVGYASFGLSYGGKRWGGWCRDKKGVRDYVKESYNAAVREQTYLRGLDFTEQDYRQLQIPKEKQLSSLIYADPPYAGTTPYGARFDHKQFWQWAEGLEVPIFVSEYQAPKTDWKPILAIRLASSLTQNTGAVTGMERLFLHRKWGASIKKIELPPGW